MAASQTFTVVDLFCGTGGLAVGFARAGFKLICAMDAWQPAVDTYRANLGDHVVHAAFGPSTNLPAADVIVGGPPCQGFSSAGMRRADDARNSLVAVFAQRVASLRPRAFVFENVEGFLTGANGRFVFDLLEPVIAAGYCVHLRKINAANYGVPQHRKRIVAIGGLGWQPSFPEPTHSAHGAPGARLCGAHLPATPNVADALSGLQSLNGDQSNITDHDPQLLEGIDLRRAQHLKPGQTMRDLPEYLWHDSYRRRAFRRVRDGIPTERRGGAPAGLRRLIADHPSKAITGGALRDFLHPFEHRMLTIRECARLQTFPDNWVFHGSGADRMQLIGNAVPPRLSECLAKCLFNDLRLGTDERPALQGKLSTFMPTLSSGMSPALEAVQKAIWSRFGTPTPRVQQRVLWH